MINCVFRFFLVMERHSHETMGGLGMSCPNNPDVYFQGTYG